MAEAGISELLPSWRPTMESYYCKVLLFEKIGALDKPESFLRLLHYPGELGNSEEEIFGASAHSDYGMITLLVCREKFNEPRAWENVPHRNGAFVINIGDMMESFCSFLNKYIGEVFAMGCFSSHAECIVQCLESCCSESSPPRFAPIRCGDYLKERFRLTYGS
uniref:Isopenicillin N synthase-like Fe(2+) 2OG dioxygenase domain-containing protein n=1 Tax=Manihot esculenta TaxID=3983 RepID=A0A2C9WJ16_MANES